jgi:hypothetical protein
MKYEITINGNVSGIYTEDEINNFASEIFSDEDFCNYLDGRAEALILDEKKTCK